MKHATALKEPQETTLDGSVVAANDAHKRPEAERSARAASLLAALRGVWPDLVQLTLDGRTATTGRLAPRYEPVLVQLFAVAMQDRFRQAFSLLQMDDGAGGTGPFDASLALASLERANAVRETAQDLRKLADILDDDALHHGAVAVDAGLAALKVARVIAQNNPVFQGEVAHALNEFTAMTAAARRARASGDADAPAAPSADTPAAPTAPKPATP